MSDFKDALHDLFSYLKSPYFDYDDYLDHKYDDDCNFDNDYHNYDCDDLVDLFSDEPIETIIEDIRNEYFRNEDIIEHYEDFKKETNIHFLSKLKFQIKNLNTLFNDKPGNMNFDSHFVKEVWIVLRFVLHHLLLIIKNYLKLNCLDLLNLHLS